MNLIHHRRVPKITSNGIKKKLKLQPSVIYLKEYTQLSTIHGVPHIFKEGETIWHRLIWAALFIICFSGAVGLIWKSWENYVQYPVEITVVNTLSDLNGALFPAVTICPSNKLIISKARDYLSKHLINKEILNDSRIIDYFKALVLFQHPLFYQMKHFLDKSQAVLNYLSEINTTDLMYKSAPKCEEIFINCWWQGKPIKCCHSMFHSQRSEEGFCYSFNSLTSDKRKQCSLENSNKDKRGCRLKKNSLGTSGPTTGAEIFIRIIASLQLQPTEFTGGTNVRVQIHHPHELPESGVGIQVPIDSLNKANIGIKVTTTDSSDAIRGLKLEDRGCLFRNEGNLNITTIYSQKSCLIECRLKYIIKRCRCLPYYFNNYNAGRNLPICNSLELECIVSLNEDLRFYKPPNTGLGFHDAEIHSALDCTHCLPTCNEVNFEFISELTKHFYVKNNNYDGNIDVYFKSGGAVRYKREVSYNQMQLLVNLGGIGGLFLGGSLLSILEIIFWFSKAILSYIFPTNNLMTKKKKQVRTSVIQAWVK